MRLDDILLQVKKPGRYIGGEWNIPKKDFDKSEIKFALCFPDLYEIGMSNLGFRILYGILNSLQDSCCERFFSPDIDMEILLRKKHSEIFSLESKRRLKSFDIVGISLGYELNYTNILNILELGGIPLESSLRGPQDPLVIGGGSCALNPEPLHDFFDLFIIGEAEEAILELMDVYRRFREKFKEGKIDRSELLFNFCGIEGVYIPSLYDVIYDTKDKIQEFKPKSKDVPSKIKKRFVKNLDNAYFPLDWLIPYIQIVHDRITLEIMRGCPNTCRFCQAHSQYFPFRQRRLEHILNLAEELYKRTGYEELSLCGLSVSDYSDAGGLLEQLADLFKARAVGVSVPSLKPKTTIGNLASQIARVKKTGLTFAPEAATERLRRVIGKDFDMQDLFKTIEQAYLAGWQHVKLYFMIGLPGEREEDLDAIVDLVSQISDLRKKLGQGPAKVNISINTLIPKPHTPLQWLRMEDLDKIKYKQSYLKGKIRNNRLKLDCHNPYMSFLEAVLSRGDRRLSQVIFSAFRKGARFDAWGNYFTFDKWREAFSELKIDPDFYLKERARDEILPWDFLDVGISKEYLLSEFDKLIDTG